MRKVRALAGSLVFLFVAPGIVVGLIPWWLTGWRVNPYSAPVQVAGAIVILIGVAILLAAFARFVFEGIGTPAPIAPTERLVVGGLYRYVRNPMYLAVGGTIAGEAIALGQPMLLAYLVAVAIVVAAFVHWYEEPTLLDRYGIQYEEYRRGVPAWLPRLRPWQPGQP